MSKGLWPMKPSNVRGKKVEQNTYTIEKGLTQRDVKKGQKHKVILDSFDTNPVYYRNFCYKT